MPSEPENPVSPSRSKASSSMTIRMGQDRPAAAETSTAASEHAFEGDYRPAGEAAVGATPRVKKLDLDFLLYLADALNTTLDLQTMLTRTAALIRAVIPYRIFAILLLNDRTNDLRMRFQIGHTPEVERLRIPIGEGVVGQVARTRQPLLINDVSKVENYINANAEVSSELAVPLIVKNRLIGVVDLQSEKSNDFQPEHLNLLMLTASRIAQAIENARLYTRASRQAATLAVLNEISQELTSILDLDPLLERIGQLLRRLIDYQMFTIMLLNQREQALEIRYSQRNGQSPVPRQKIPISRGLVGLSARERRVVNIPDVRKDPNYFRINPETRSEMIVPLIYKGNVIGVLDLEHSRTNFFNEEHERTLLTLAAQIAIAIENARLYQHVMRQEQRLESDLEMAREVQLRLLPQGKPQHPNAEFASRFLPARAIGGDMFDFLTYDPSHTAVAVGDVSGKAAPAALYAALVSGIMRSASAQRPSPAEMLGLLNDSLQERRLDSQYVTMLFSLWNDENRTLQIANAGAVQPLFCRSGEVDTIRAEGFPLGLFPGVSYEEFSVATQPGDSIIFFSDGIPDAQNRDGEMFGTERLVEVVKKNQRKNVNHLADTILNEVGRFQDGIERFDDETVVVLRVR